MIYEPSFYTTESYKAGGGNTSLVHPQQYYTGKDHHAIPGRGNLMLGVVNSQDEESGDEQIMQSFTNISEHKKQRTTSTKKPIKVKRSESNGSQQKNTLLNKIFRSSKTIKSPQSRQSNMNLNN
jgi:hypothetical protein